MYLRRFSVDFVRAVKNVVMTFDRGREAGWHVILGPNGSGKSSLVRSFALLAMGEKEAYAARQDFSGWVQEDAPFGMISGTFVMDENYDILSGSGQAPTRAITAQVILQKGGSYSRSSEANYSGERTSRTIWGGGQGWFCASFGPFRRFTGGDRIYDRLFVSNKRLAPHLTALGEDVALTDAMSWLTSLYVRTLEDDKKARNSEASDLLTLVVSFLNESRFLPHKSHISSITDNAVYVCDGNEVEVALDQLSDGYRSALSLVIELIRQMFELYGSELMRKALTTVPGTIQAPGIVFIDEIDVHLHPTWQRDIGLWLTKYFPCVQFIVTTHSPMVCRAVANENGQITGSIWKLPPPGDDGDFYGVVGDELLQLAFGDVLDAYSTELFGQNVTRSEIANRLLDRLASLNTKALVDSLTDEEKQERANLRRLFPMNAGGTIE